MQYRLTLLTPETTMQEELRTNETQATKIAFGMLESNQLQGEVVIERRHGEGQEYNHYMTCKHNYSL